MILAANALAVSLAAAAASAEERVRAQLTPVGEKIVDTAKARAPVLTGAFRGSISMTVEATAAEIGPTDPNRAKVLAIEYGNSRQGPNPVMGPALDAHAEEFVQAMVNVVEDI